MTDETQTSATPAPAAEAAATPPAVKPEAKPDEQAEFQRLVDGNIPPEPKEPPKAEEKPAAEMPDWAAERVARAKRQRDEARGEKEWLGTKLEEFRDVVAKLTQKLDPNSFPTHDAYEAAKREVHKKAEDLLAPDAKPDPQAAAVDQATKDLAFEVRRTDPELWSQVVAVDDKGQPKVRGITQAMVIAIADADDSAGKLRALLAMPEEDRLDLADLSERMQRKEIARLAPVAKSGKAAPEAPTAQPPGQAGRDPATGQFTKRVSDAPPPINPVSGASTGEVPLDRASFADFERRRNESKQAERFGW